MDTATTNIFLTGPARTSTWVVGGVAAGRVVLSRCLVAVSLALSLLLPLAACSSGSGGGSSFTPTPAATPVPVDNTAELAKVHLPPASFSAKVDLTSAVMGQTLTCSGITTGDNSTTLSYSFQWVASAAPGGTFVAVSGETAATLAVTQPLAHQWLKCLVSAKDSQSLTTVSSPSATVAVKNTAPQTFKPTISQSSAVSGDTLTCQGTTGDVDGDKLTYSYQWLISDAKGGTYVEVPGATSQGLLITGDQVGKFTECQMTAFDGLSRGTSSASDPASIGDTPPLSFVATVSTLHTHVLETITCSGSTSSPDGDILSYSYQWLMTPALSIAPAALVGQTGASLSVTAAMAHQFLLCNITAADTHLGTTVSVSPALTQVDNSSPSPFTSWTSEDAALVNDKITCTAAAKDIDGDPLTYTYQWFLSSSPTGNFPALTSEVYSTLSVTPAYKRQYLKCQVTADDGLGGVTVGAASAAVYVANSSPLPFAATADNALVPGSAHVLMYGSINCNGSTTDIDDDVLTSSSYTYQWSVAAADVGPFLPLAGATGSSLYIDLSLKHQVLLCRITADDGFGGVTNSTISNVVYVDNTRPADFAATTSAVSQTTKVNDVLLCSGVTTDLDNDHVAYAFQWSKADSVTGTYTPISTGSLPSLTVTPEVAHKFIACQITATDGYGGVTPSSVSPVITVLNTRPNDFAVTLPLANSRVQDTDVCAGTTTDNDLDPGTWPSDVANPVPLVYTTSWYIAPAATGPFVPLVRTDPVTQLPVNSPSLTIIPAYTRQYLQCQKVTDDGFGGVTTSQISNVHYIENTPPANFTAAVDQTDVAVGGAIGCTGSTTDADLDLIHYSFRWQSAPTVTGPYIDLTQSQLSAIAAVSPGALPGVLPVTYLSAHQFITCIITATDGYLNGSGVFVGYGGVTQSAASSVVTIDNTPPAVVAPGAVPSKLTVYVTSPVPDSVTCNGSATDVDHDDLTFTPPLYEWFRLSSPSATPLKILGAGSPKLDIDVSMAHQFLQCRITFYDSFGGSASTGLSPVITVADSAPVFLAAASTDVSSVAIGGLINCSDTAYSDSDNDLVTTIGYNWYATLDGVTFVPISVPPPTLSCPLGCYTPTPTAAVAHHSFACEVVVSDGIWGGVTVSPKSPLVTYTNTPPLPFAATLTTDVTGSYSVQVGQNIYCGGTTTDPDGDTPSYTTTFYTGPSPSGPFTTPVAGATNIPGVGPIQYKVAFGQAHSYISCQRTATDGYGGTTAPSAYPQNPVQVLNSAPVFTASTLVPRTVAEGTTITFSVAATDADHDALTYTCTSCPADGSAGTMTAAGVYSWTPPYTVANRQTPSVPTVLAFNVTDGYQGSTNGSMTLTVTDTNRQPTLTCTGGTYNETDSVIAITYAVTNPDGDPLTIGYQSGFPSPASTYSVVNDQANSRFYIAGDYNIVDHSGSYPYQRTLSVTLSGAYTNAGTPAWTQNASVTCNLVINDIDRPATVGGVGGCGTFNEGTTITLTAPAVTDLDGDLYTVSYVGGMPFSPTPTSGTPGVTMTFPASYGYATPSQTSVSYTPTFDVFYASGPNNGKFYQTTSCNVTVNQVAAPPTCGSQFSLSFMSTKTAIVSGGVTYYAFYRPTTSLSVTAGPGNYNIPSGATSNVSLQMYPIGPAQASGATYNNNCAVICTLYGTTTTYQCLNETAATSGPDLSVSGTSIISQNNLSSNSIAYDVIANSCTSATLYLQYRYCTSDGCSPWCQSTQ